MNMRGKSHCRLGAYLADTYFPQASAPCRTAFLLGCIEPDRNPATYLKGSLRAQWLRGHNYENAKHFMLRISRRLERKQHWSLLDYYTAGKLIHYTMDAFTYAHNASFPTDLREHKKYEDALQEYFLTFLRNRSAAEKRPGPNVMDTISRHHRDYLSRTPDIFRDARYAFSVSCCVAGMLACRPAAV